ncbi:MAG: MFS transporter [Promethearchaeia archaeon]
MSSQEKIKQNGKLVIEEMLPIKNKVAFGSASASSAALQGIFFAAITFFYNYKLGVSGDLVGIAWLLFAGWNAINDPLFGFLEDRTRSEKYGRRIPYIRFGAPFYGLFFILSWFPFFDPSNEIGLFINLLIVLFLFDTIFTIIGLIIYSLPAEMTISSKARSNLMVYGTIIGSIGLLVSFLLPVLLLTGDKSTELNPFFRPVMILVGVVCAMVMFISSFYLKENKFAQIEEPMSFIEGLKHTFQNKPFLNFEVSNFSFVLAQTILISGIFYYVEFILGLGELTSVIPLLLVFLMIFGFAVLFSHLVERFGLKKIYVFGLTWTGLSFLIFFLLGWIFSTAIIGLMLLGIGFSAILITVQAVMGDIIDYDELQTDRRRETTYAGVNALITKPAISIANWLFLLIIGAFGFEEGAATQPFNAKLGIMIAFCLLPAAFILMSSVLMRRFKLEGPEWIKEKKKLKKIHEKKEKKYLKHIKQKKQKKSASKA